LLQSPLGESFSPVASEVDLDGAAKAFGRACELACELGDVPALAAATRELGVVDLGRGRALVVQRTRGGDMLEFARRAAAGESPAEIVGGDVLELMNSAAARYRCAAELFEEVGDRRGVTSSIIALAYAEFGLDIHMFGSAQRVGEIKRLSQQTQLLARESEREAAELQMLYGVHVFARAKTVPDLALSRGEEAYRHARMLGDRLLEFAAASGVALTHVELDDVPRAAEWVELAAAVAAASPTPFRTRQLELVRGGVAAAAGDHERMRAHLERAVALAREQGRPAALAETLARLAVEAARTGAGTGAEALLGLAERSALEARDVAASLPGHPPFAALAEAALADVALARGDAAAAAEAARRAQARLAVGRSEDMLLEVLLPAARALRAGGSDAEQEAATAEMRSTALMVAQRILDEDVRVRWFRSPLGRQLSELAGTGGARIVAAARNGRTIRDGSAQLGADETDLLWLVVEGRTNRELARELGLTEEQVVRRLGELYAALGVTSRAGAAVVAFGSTPPGDE
jgi:DNA-binding NarL/FixJ family response regulator